MHSFNLKLFFKCFASWRYSNGHHLAELRDVIWHVYVSRSFEFSWIIFHFRYFYFIISKGLINKWVISLLFKIDIDLKNIYLQYIQHILDHMHIPFYYIHFVKHRQLIKIEKYRSYNFLVKLSLVMNGLIVIVKLFLISIIDFSGNGNGG